LFQALFTLQSIEPFFLLDSVMQLEHSYYVKDPRNKISIHQKKKGRKLRKKFSRQTVSERGSEPVNAHLWLCITDYINSIPKRLIHNIEGTSLIKRKPVIHIRTSYLDS